jgi:hypothetical protein
MKTYGVCIGTCLYEDNFCFFECKNKTEARQRAVQYKRAWNIHDPIIKIVEIPNDIKSDSDARINYAVSAAK